MNLSINGPCQNLTTTRAWNHLLRPSTHSLRLPRQGLPDLARRTHRPLILANDDRPVQRARVRDDARDERADAVEVREEHRRGARLDRHVRHCLHAWGGGAARGEGEEDLHPCADVDEGVGDVEGFDVFVDGVFLRVQ